jgi:hypothetical protein
VSQFAAITGFIGTDGATRSIADVTISHCRMKFALRLALSPASGRPALDLQPSQGLADGRIAAGIAGGDRAVELIGIASASLPRARSVTRLDWSIRSGLQLQAFYGWAQLQTLISSK